MKGSVLRWVCQLAPNSSKNPVVDGITDTCRDSAVCAQSVPVRHVSDADDGPTGRHGSLVHAEPW